MAQTGTITAPKANDVWTFGATEQIQWTYSGKCLVRLVLYDQSGAKAGIIKSGLQLTDGAFSWPVGQLEGGASVAPAKGYRIQLRIDGTGVTLANSAGSFEIVSAAVIPPAPLPPPPPPPTPPSPPSNQLPVINLQRQTINRTQMTAILRVTKPVDGTQVFPGDTCPIEWSLAGGGYTNMKIIRYPEGRPDLANAGQGILISEGTENDGSYDWKLSDLERTGKFVVRVQTQDGKLHGDSGVVAINQRLLPPNQMVRVRAPDVDTLLAQSASISIEDLGASFGSEGKLNGAGMTVRVNTASDFVLSPAVGHPQYGSLYLRCLIENPYTDGQGNFSVSTVMDAIVSLKGGGGSQKLDANPANIAKGSSVFNIAFNPQYSGAAVGQEVVQPMAGGWGGGGNKCFQQYFPKMTITVHLVTKSGEAVAGKSKYLIYSPKIWPLSPVILSGEVNICQEGMQQW